RRAIIERPPTEVQGGNRDSKVTTAQHVRLHQRPPRRAPMRVGIISVFTDYHRRGRHHRGFLQPQVGALIAALLPPQVDCEVINDTWTDPDWSRDYDLLFLSCLHSDFDRARQVSHYWRRRGAKTVLGGPMATLYPDLCAPYFDAAVSGDPEATIPAVHED